MKKMVDIIALERELTQRLDFLNADSSFLQTDRAQSKINTLIERLRLIELIKNNYEVIQWIMGEGDVTRAKLIDQDKV
jgi:predicted rRNA methylase YqxC with S4 and FtsJ domains|tara:strand:+ start:472 stop:705 length:234 start_codon:yes stop_codon:yes gene_type:complete